MDKEPLYSFSEAIRVHFDIQLAKHSQMRLAVDYLLKALAKANVISLKTKPDAHNKHWLIPSSEMIAVHNAVLLHGIFSEYKLVTRLFLSPGDRAKHAKWVGELLLGRQSVANLALTGPKLSRFLEQLDSDLDLKTVKLANPFPGPLPQIGLADYGGNLLRAVTLQTAVLSTGDSMMAHYLNGDLSQAYEHALKLNTENELLSQYRELILREYQRAKEFDDLLDFLR